jgi:hypothetical protein
MIDVLELRRRDVKLSGASRTERRKEKRGKKKVKWASRRTRHVTWSMGRNSTIAL